MEKNSLLGEWLLVVFVPSIILLLGKTFAEILKEINIIWAILMILITGILYFAELYSLIMRSLEQLGIKI